MPAGLQVWDAAGNLIQDITDRLPRIAGIITITADGSVTVPGAGSQNDIWYYIAPSSTIAYTPAVTLSGTTLTWSGTEPGGTWLLIYGLY